MADRRTLYKDHVDIGGGYNHTYQFEFIEQDDGTIHIYILRQPSYQSGQDTGGHNTHRYGVGSRPYICYDPMPRTLSDAKNIALEWAKRTSYYIRHNAWPNVGSSITR